jgi:hypothetical protein
VAWIHIECELSVGCDHQGWRTPSVHRQRRAGKRLGAHDEERATGRHRVGAGADGSGDYDSVSRHTNIGIIAHRNLDDDLAGTTPDHDQVVYRAGAALGCADPEGRQATPQPLAGRNAVESLWQFSLRNGCEHPDAAARDAEYGCVRLGGGV